MHTVLFSVLLILLLYTIFKDSFSCKTEKRLKDSYLIDLAKYPGLPSSKKGLNELEQSTRSRGYVPEILQPNHTANLWKCEYSHPQMSNGHLDTVFASDYPTPIRGGAVHLNVSDNSCAHKLSRFGSVDSY